MNQQKTHLIYHSKEVETKTERSSILTKEPIQISKRFQEILLVKKKQENERRRLLKSIQKHELIIIHEETAINSMLTQNKKSIDQIYLNNAKRLSLQKFEKNKQIKYQTCFSNNKFQKEHENDKNPVDFKTSHQNLILTTFHKRSQLKDHPLKKCKFSIQTLLQTHEIEGKIKCIEEIIPKKRMPNSVLKKNAILLNQFQSLFCNQNKSKLVSTNNLRMEEMENLSVSKFASVFRKKEKNSIKSLMTFDKNIKKNKINQEKPENCLFFDNFCDFIHPEFIRSKFNAFETNHALKDKYCNSNEGDIENGINIRIGSYFSASLSELNPGSLGNLESIDGEQLLNFRKSVSTLNAKPIHSTRRNSKRPEKKEKSKMENQQIRFSENKQNHGKSVRSGNVSWMSTINALLECVVITNDFRIGYYSSFMKNALARFSEFNCKFKSSTGLAEKIKADIDNDIKTGMGIKFKKASLFPNQVVVSDEEEN